MSNNILKNERENVKAQLISLAIIKYAYTTFIYNIYLLQCSLDRYMYVYI